MPSQELAGQRVTLMGLGRHGGGVAAARWLAGQGAIVTVTDLRDEAALADSRAELSDVPIAAWHLAGHHAADFTSAELLVVNPAVRPDNSYVAAARAAGVRITSEIELFLERCPATVIGVTGSNGKSTTAAMIAAILNSRVQSADSHETRWLGRSWASLAQSTRSRPRPSDAAVSAHRGIDAAFPMYADFSSNGRVSAPATRDAQAGRQVWLGGNIGRSLLGELASISRTDYVVLELSSFQLDWLPEEAVWPRIAVVTNCTPNHLDWHGSFDGYFAAKQRLLRYQTANSAAVLNVNDPLVRQWQKLVHGRLLAVESDCDVPLLRVPGQHNRHNAALAAAAAIAIGCSQAAIADALATFRGLPHRLELVAEVAGRRFYNDSMATTPESVVAAVETFAGGWFLVGGHDKGFDFTEMAARLARGASGVACFGAARDKISAIIARQPRRRCAVHSCETLVDALAWCWSLAQIGDAIVLSPACASYDQFRDYRDRGEKFIALTRALADRDALSAR